MGRTRMLDRQLPVVAMLLVTVVGLAAWLGGCGSAPRPETGTRPELSEEELAQARHQYAELKREHSLRRDRQSLQLAGNLLDYYPGFARNDEVLDMAVESARRLDDLPRARKLADELLLEHPESPLVDETLLTAADLAASLADTAGAAAYLIRYHDRDPERSTVGEDRYLATPYLERLTPGDLAGLMAEFPASDLVPYLGYLRTRGLVATQSFGEAEEQVLALEQDHRQRKWTVAARALFDRPGAVRRPVPPTGPVAMDQVGVLSPLTGRYAVLGNAMYDAALLAVRTANAETGRHFVLKVEDTQGDPVIAALAARQLCSEAGSVAILGALMSDPTTAAAVVTDYYGVPLVSPTATNDHIWHLGPHIFQTNLTGVYETRLIAELAVTVLLKRRLAILHPDTPEGETRAQVFARTVEQLGGEIVATAAYPEQATDFRREIMSLTEHRPEVIFTPATVDQMVLLGPQLDFYRAGALVMGLSNLNSTRLLERTGPVLERVVFPSDRALFPPHWIDEFNAGWHADNYPREAAALALKTYQATRMLLDTLHASNATNRAQLATALTNRMANRDIEASGPDSYGRIVHVVRDQRIVPFPAELFQEAWELTEGAVVDSLEAAAAFSADEQTTPADRTPPPAETPGGRSPGRR